MSLIDDDPDFPTTGRGHGGNTCKAVEAVVAELRAKVEKLTQDLSSDGNWQSWAEGNQAVNVEGQSPFKGEHCAAAVVKGLPRAWNPHFVGLNVFSLPTEFNVSRFRQADADFIAAAPRLVRQLLDALTAAEARAEAAEAKVVQLKADNESFKAALTGDYDCELVRTRAEVERLTAENAHLRELLGSLGPDAN